MPDTFQVACPECDSAFRARFRPSRVSASGPWTSAPPDPLPPNQDRQPGSECALGRLELWRETHWVDAKEFSKGPGEITAAE
jgi:hypothetical protein